MKKVLIIGSISFSIGFTLLAVAILLFSFLKIKPITKSINSKIETKLQDLVFIPKGVTKTAYTFESTSLVWEMETLQKEFVGVELFFTPGYTKEDRKIIAQLKMVEIGDPSIFEKTLPALIRDQESLQAAYNVKEPNPTASQGAMFSKLSLEINKQKEKATTIEWEFNKSDMDNGLNEEYKKLEKYPKPLLKLLITLPKLIIGLLSGS